MKWITLAGALAMAACGTQPQPLPVYSRVPEFRLTAHSGDVFSRERLDGNIWVADFIFTTCTGPCPRMSSLMRQVQTASKDMPDVKLVSFTVDPEHDTPAVLAEYANRYQAQKGRWYFLTGDRKTLDALNHDAFKLGNVDGSLNHSTRLVLVDRAGRVRGYYGTDEDSPVPRLMRDLKRLRREGS